VIELLGFGEHGWGGQLLQGTAMTLAVALCAFGLGLGFGLVAATAKLGGHAVARRAADAYTTVVRGVPELLVIYLLFFGSGKVLAAIAGMFGYGGYIEINAFTVGALAVGLISGSYSTEVLRGAIQAVPSGQIEAGRALGMTRPLILRRILVPQTLRYALPGLGNVWQLTLKDTALISVTALEELMRKASVAAGSTRSPFVFYGAAAVLYLVLTSASTFAFHRAERRANRGVRRA
jgi:octopine/nopaline transport system permease protein